MSSMLTKSDSDSSGREAGTSDLSFSQPDDSSTGATHYLNAVRDSLSFDDFIVNPKKLRQAILQACKDELEEGRVVRAADYAWLAENPATHLDSLFVAKRDVDHDPKRFPMSLGNFVLLGMFGHGGFGTVYHAWDTSKNRFAALKVLNNSGNTNARRRLIKEAKLLARVRNTHVVRVYGAHEIDRETAISMEILDGSNLAQILVRDGRLPRKEAAEMARQISAGIAAAHKNRVIHRDLKPGNIVSDSHGRWFVIDFGLAKTLDQVDSQSAAKDAPGTQAYASLEQILQNDVAEPADIFGIGLLLFEAVTGHRPFDAKVEFLRAEQIVNQTGISSKANRRLLGPSLYAIVRKCLQPYSEHRYESAAALQDDLANFLAGRTVNARPPSLADDIVRLVRSHQRSFAVITVLFLLAIFASLVYVDRRTQQKIGRDIQRAGWITSANNEITSDGSNARQRAIDKLEHVANEFGNGDDLVQPYIDALLKQGFEEVWKLPGDQYLGFDVCDNGKSAAVATRDGTIQIITRGQGTVESLNAPTREPIIYLEWAPGGKHLASMQELPADASPDLRRPFVVRETTNFNPLEIIPAGIQDEGWAFSRDGNAIVVADASKFQIRLIDLSQKRERSHFAIPAGKWVRRLALGPDANWVAISYANSNVVEVRNLSSGVVSDSWQFKEGIQDIDVSVMGTIAVASGNDVLLFEQGLSQATSILHAHTAQVDRVRFSARGDRMLTRSNRQHFKIWNVSSGAMLLQHLATRHVRFVRHDREVAGIVDPDGFVVCKLTEDEYCPTIQTARPRNARSAVFSRNGSMLFVSSNDGLLAWKIDERELNPTVIDRLPCGEACLVGADLFSSHRFQVRLRSDSDFANEDATKSVSTDDHHYGSLMNVSANGQRLAIVQHATSTVRVLDADSSQWYDDENVRALVISRDAQRLATASRSVEPVIKIRDLSQGKLIAELPCEAHSLAFLADSKFLVAGTRSVYQVWDVEKKDIVASVPHAGVGIDVPCALSADGQWLAAILDEKSITILDTTTWKKAISLPTNAAQVKRLTFSPRLDRVAAVRYDAAILVWELDKLKTQCERVGLTWPLDVSPHPLAERTTPVLLLSASNIFQPSPSVAWLSKATFVASEAAPIHRRIESLRQQIQSESLALGDGRDETMETLARECFSLGGPGEALRMFQQANALKPTNSRRYFIGLLQVILGRTDEYLADRYRIRDEPFEADGINLWLTRYCLLHPIDDSELRDKILRSFDNLAERFPQTDWLQTIKALALTRADQAKSAADLLRESVNGDWGSLDSFEKSVAVLSLKESGDESESAKVLDLYRRHPEHRFEDLRLFSQQLISESNSASF